MFMDLDKLNVRTLFTDEQQKNIQRACVDPETEKLYYQRIDKILRALEHASEYENDAGYEMLLILERIATRFQDF